MSERCVMCNGTGVQEFSYLGSSCIYCGGEGSKPSAADKAAGRLRAAAVSVDLTREYWELLQPFAGLARAVCAVAGPWAGGEE